MNPNIEYKVDSGTLVIQIDGFLDCRCNYVLNQIIHSDFRGCRHAVIDLHGVERVFDSGLAVLTMFCNRLLKLGIVYPRVVGDQAILLRCEQGLYLCAAALSHRRLSTAM